MSEHQELFKEILSIQPYSKERERVYATYFAKSFKNFGKIFNYSYMWDVKLPYDAQLRQKYAEEIAAKYNCKVSFRAVYSTKGSIDDLWKVREELINTMYVSPIMWTPLRTNSDKEFGHYHTFAFGFFPYCEKKEFIYDDSVDIDSMSSEPCYKEDFIETDLSVDALHKIVSRRIKSIRENFKPSEVCLIKDDDISINVSYILTKDNLCNEINDADDFIYSNDLSAEEYFNAVIAGNNAECFIVPECKLLFAKSNSKLSTYDTDTSIKKEIQCIWNLLSKRIAVSCITAMIVDDYWCYCFSYDDTRLDSFNQHIGFFNVHEYLD